VESLVVGVDASRNRSGGAKCHLISILAGGELLKHGIREVHVWAYKSLLDALPDRPWLIKHTSMALEKGLVSQLLWQATSMSREAVAAGCDIVFTTDASTLCRFRPMVVLSQDLLSYEPGVMRYFGYGKARLRLLAILALQSRAFRRADGVIFLTHYAAKVIQQSCGLLPRIAYIGHGVGEAFRQASLMHPWPASGERPIRCLYVSNAAMYKHQWVVVRAIEVLRKSGHNITLTLVGGGSGRAQKLLDEQIAASDPDGVFVEQLDFVPQKELPGHLENADMFVFASSCETFGITLCEAMAVGLPIGCSNLSSLPETLQDGGVYFDPKDYISIAAAIEKIISNPELRRSLAHRAKDISEQYSWARCADETWAFIADTYKSIK